MSSSNGKRFLLCGVLLSCIGGFGFYSLANKIQNPVPVVVATQTIEPHMEITEKMVQVIDVPSIGRSEQAIDNKDLVVGGYTTTRVFAGQTFLQPMVAKQFDESGVSGLALSIPNENLRAISFPVTAAQTVNGKLKKGDYVDIIATFDESKLGTTSGITRTIMQGVEVFDVEGEGSEITSIALLVPLEYAEIISHAYSVGTVSFALNPGDSKPATTQGVINSTLCKRYGYNCSPTK